MLVGTAADSWTKWLSLWKQMHCHALGTFVCEHGEALPGHGGDHSNLFGVPSGGNGRASYHLHCQALWLTVPPLSWVCWEEKIGPLYCLYNSNLVTAGISIWVTSFNRKNGCCPRDKLDSTVTSESYAVPNIQSEHAGEQGSNPCSPSKEPKKLYYYMTGKLFLGVENAVWKMVR